MKTRINKELFAGLLLLAATGHRLCAGPVDAAYIANWHDNTVSVIGRERMDSLATIPVGGHPTRIIASPDDKRVFVINEGSNSVSVIDTAAGTVVATLAVGTQPSGLAISPDSQRLYVVNYGSANMSVIDVSSATLTGTVPIASNPTSIGFHPQRAELWIGYGSLATALEVRRADDYSVLASIRNTSRNYEFSSRTFTPDGATLWTAENCGCCGRFHKLSGNISNRTVASVEQDILFDDLGAAYALAVNPATAQAYFAKSGHCGGIPSIYESGSGRKVALSAMPRDMAVDASQGRLWVALANGNVAVIDLYTMTTSLAGSAGGRAEGIAFAPFGSTCGSAAAPNERLVGTYTVNYRYNAAGSYTDQSHPDFTQANPYRGNTIPPGPIFIDAAPGRYRIVTESGGCSVWSGNASSGQYYSSTPSVEFDHSFGQIALYYWDWYTDDNDPSVQSQISVYSLEAESLTSLAVTPLNPVISTAQNLQFTATGTYPNQASRPLTASDGLSWSSSDPSIVTVDAFGLAIPIRQGIATITATVCAHSVGTQLVITNLPPRVTPSPVDRVVSPGAEVSWCVDLHGSQPMTLQWQLNGVNLPGEDGRCLTIPKANQTAAGLYSLVASNAFGTVKISAGLSLMEIRMFAGLTIAGPAGAYRIEARDAFENNNAWFILGTNRVGLSEIPFHYFDTNSPNIDRRFYRSIWMPE